jgi:invasion protein IalB
MIITMRTAIATASLTTVFLAGLVPLVANAQTTTVEGTFGAWSLYANDNTGAKLCFAAAAPTEKKPATANRGPTLLYVSAWPKDGIRSEVSVKLGYPVKPDSTVTVTIGTDTFSLFAKDERAYVADPTQELKLVEALKKGSKADVTATSARGTETTDTYTLSGLTQALTELSKTCK